MAQISRRNLVSLLGSGAAGLTLAPLTTFYARAAHAHGTPAFGAGFGPLSPQYPINGCQIPEALRNIAFITLPPGFEYLVVSTTGTTMSDGNLVPGGHDGMAAFRGPNGTTVVVRNHELGTSGIQVAAPPSAMYNPAAFGGTTTMIFDNQGWLQKHYASLGGTARNCAGGPTPWDTWLTCEETFSELNGIRHGYVFEVPAFGLGNPIPLKGLGRFNHEAAAVDPKTGIVYLTEDRGDSLLYRFVPKAYGDLRSPGRLEALRLTDWPGGVNTRTGFLDKLFVALTADWVAIDDVDPATDTMRAEGQSRGAATFSRGEGIWYGNGLVYFCCSNGGDLGKGQIFAYDPVSSTVTLVVESVDAAVLESPDNITVGPDGRLYLCEDGANGDNIVGVNRDGELFMVAQNNFNGSEFAGACFSHDGRFMFVNTQSPGLTYVIRGPWRKGQR